MIKRIHLTIEPFTVDNGCLTPTFKIRRYVDPPPSLHSQLTADDYRRKETYAKFKRELDALYDLPAPTSSKL